MARSFSGVDTVSWKLMDGNKIVTNEKGEPLNTFKGFKDAGEASRKYGGVPVRV